MSEPYWGNMLSWLFWRPLCQESPLLPGWSSDPCALCCSWLEPRQPSGPTFPFLVKVWRWKRIKMRMRRNRKNRVRMRRRRTRRRRPEDSDICSCKKVVQCTFDYKYAKWLIHPSLIVTYTYTFVVLVYNFQCNIVYFIYSTLHNFLLKKIELNMSVWSQTWLVIS